MKFLSILIMVCFGALTACSKLDSQPTLVSPIVFAVGQSPLNLDPRYATDAASERINRLLYQPLVDFDAQSRPKPALASWKQINPTQYRFTLLAQAAVFHHGGALTANDIASTYGSLKQLTNSPHAAEFNNIKQITVLDRKTLDFYLEQPDKQFVAKLIIGILPKNLIDVKHDFSRSPIGSGPLKFVSWENQLLLERVSDHQLIRLVEVKDPTVRVLKLLHGEIDVLQGDLPPEMVKYLQTKPELNVLSGIGVNFSYLGLNCQDALLKNPKVRRAIAHAIDRQAIIQKVMVANTRQAQSILPPEHYTNSGAITLESYHYNPTLAKKLLLEAGVKLPLHLVYKSSTDAQRLRFATIMQAQMQDAGIALEIRSLDWGTFFEDVKQGNFQLYGLTWVGIKTPEIYTKVFASNSLPPNGFNRGRFIDPELDTMLAHELWSAATQRIHAQLPYIPLWYEGQFVAMRKGVHHFKPKPDGNWDDLAQVKKDAH